MNISDKENIELYLSQWNGYILETENVEMLLILGVF